MSLPSGWVQTPLDDLLEYVTSGSRDWSQYYSKTGAAFIRTENINTDALDLSEVARVELPERVEGKRSLVREGDLLLTITGANVGKCAAVAITPPEAYVSQSVALVRPRDKNLSKFLHRFLTAPGDFGRGQLDRAAYGVGRPVLNLTNIREIQVYLPPLPEQHRIVAKIEELFSELDAGVAALERAQAKLERYRASVLKAAVEGKLTERWRAENPPEETGAELLERILVERRKRWEEEQLARFAAKGKKPPTNWREKYKEPVGADVAELPELPEGWCWGTVDQLGAVGSGITKGGKKRSAIRRPVPYLRVANVQRGFLDLTELKPIEASEDEILRHLLEPGDVLFNEGGDRDKLGRGWVWRGEIPECLHQNHVFRVRPFLEAYSSELLSHYGNSAGRDWFFGRATQTVNLASINQTVLRSLPVPLPPLREQRELVDRLSGILQTVDITLREIAHHRTRAAALRQSILARAFSGRLVPKDASDEPASVLLKRIRAERGATQEARKTTPVLDFE